MARDYSHTTRKPNIDRSGDTRFDVGQRIFNPDGSEAEKSGNGLRIFARALWDQHLVSDNNPSEQEAKQYGPMIEQDSRFANRTNVQFMKVIDRNNIRIEIWERGAGYTLASGSSSTAAAAVAKKTWIV